MYDVLCFRFHLLKPEYVHHRIKQMQRGYRLRIILCHVDIEDVVESLNQVWRHVMHMGACHVPHARILTDYAMLLMLTASRALQVTRAAVLNDCTLFCAFSSQVTCSCPLCACALSQPETW